MSAATGPLPERVPVLVIDDDEIVRTWVRHSLDESEFYVLESAETAAEAERTLESSRPALLLVDYRLPDVDGIELVRRLRRRGVTTPAVLMTAATHAGLNHAAVEAGFQGAYVKSGRGEPLLEALRLARSGDPAFDHRNARPGSNGGPAGDLDLRLPDLDGLEVLERLRALEGGEELPIVLLTGEAGGRLASLQQAADLVLTKPLDLGRFFEIVALLRGEAAAPLT